MDSYMEDGVDSIDGYESSTSESSSYFELGSDEPDNPDLNLDAGDHVTTITTDAEPVPDNVEEQTTIHARAYQMEMFEESLKQNIIVAMDTGSGKTQVAVLRIKAELERSSDKLIWFLVPTVALCEQQYRVLRSQISAAQIKLLSGSDDVESWSDQRIWDDYLRDVHIVVSTFQVLLDAISHAFVKLAKLSLIVIDEAHNCVGKHPGRKIMERYHLNKSHDEPIPAILGLTASPIMNSNLDSLERIEQTLDAICKTPTLHRAELISSVNRPTFSCIPFVAARNRIPTDSRSSLIRALRSLNIYEDPYIHSLHRQGTERSMLALEKAFEKRKTPNIDQMESLCRKSHTIEQELGTWATDYFNHTAVTHFLDFQSPHDPWADTWKIEARQFLAAALRSVEVRPSGPLESATSGITHKFETLVAELVSAPADTIGIIFAKERATVAVLHHMLSIHPSTKERFRTGSMIGSSSYSPRKRDLWDYTPTKDGLDLEEFRAGKLNLLVATSVLEEGIDVPACNLVICFDELPNLKSFIQRRGRARMKKSRLVLLMEESSNQLKSWTALEEEMKRRYESDMRTAAELAEIEDEEASIEMPPLYIPATGARLDFDQAKPHLEHFCTKITSKQYVDHRPYYITQKIGGSSMENPSIKATVVLPTSLPQHLRRIEGRRSWTSEKNACKDAAFQAFKAVYEAGLVNDNLMPLTEEFEDIEKRTGIIEANELWVPWPKIARLWEQSNEVVQRRVSLKHGDRIFCDFEASLPRFFPAVPAFPIFWNKETVWTVEISVNSASVPTSALSHDQSPALLDLAFGHRFSIENAPQIMHLQSSYDIEFKRDVARLQLREDSIDADCLIRDQYGHPFTFDKWLPSRPDLQEVRRKLTREAEEHPVDVPWVALGRLPKRHDFLRAPIRNPSTASATTKRYHRISPASFCTMDVLDRTKFNFGAIIPSILHVLELHLAAEELSSTILKDVGFTDLSLVITATASRAAHESVDYERLEFLGDSILKLLATLSVMVQHPKYPEGYLSAKKDRIVSNVRLCHASLEIGLDKFIRTRSFTASKWRPLYIKDFLLNEAPASTRKMSSKTLADVVESLIGAAHQDGGMPKALACLRIFLPECEWHDLPEARSFLLQDKPVKTEIPALLGPLEALTGYSFSNKATLEEAVTHASWNPGAYTDEACMERLEFLGDSILDSIVVSALWTYAGRELSNQEMHLFRVACVNADLLGFLVMEWHLSRAETRISSDGGKTTLVAQTEVPFWKFMRHNSGAVSSAQLKVEKRHADEREGILKIIAGETEYPWTELAHLDIPKFFSDMFESLVGAVWVDSGSIEVCTEVVERIGILPYLRHMLAHGIDVRHPKNKLGELAGKDRKTVRYESETVYKNGGAGSREGPGDRICRVFVDDVLVVEVNGGINPLEAETRAADAAWRVLVAAKKKEAGNRDGKDTDMDAGGHVDC